jgi:glycosyltransferase involved in cell wall biosynthesis
MTESQVFFSVVIRNKNEGSRLEKTLFLLTNVYADFVNEIILVDNDSTDNSLIVAEKYGCKILKIDDFTYGRASNLGISHVRNKYVLLLSAHAVPAGASFFSNTMKALSFHENLAGIRYNSSFDSCVRSVINGGFVVEPLKYGIVAACAMINKEIWAKHKFDENLIALEDKEWSSRVVSDGYSILDLNEPFFYEYNRGLKGDLIRNQKEAIALHALTGAYLPGKFKYVQFYFKKIFLSYPQRIINDVYIETRHIVKVLLGQ